MDDLRALYPGTIERGLLQGVHEIADDVRETLTRAKLNINLFSMRKSI